MISVIVPVYGVEPYLDKCVSSILGQTYRDLEIILVDDESPDNCPAMCDAWAKKDPRVTVIHKKHGGLSDARNTGLDQAHGEFITFVDSDDFIATTMCERLASAQTETNADIVICNFAWRLEDFVVVNRSPLPKVQCSFYGKELLSIFFPKKGYGWDWDLCTAWGKLYRRNLFEGTHTIRYPSGKTFEDTYVTYKTFYVARKVTAIPDPLYVYQRRNGSISTSIDLPKLDDMFSIFKDMLPWCHDNAPDVRQLIEHGAYLRFFCLLKLAGQVPSSKGKTNLIQDAWSLLKANSNPYLRNPNAGLRAKSNYVLYCLGLLRPLKTCQMTVLVTSKNILQRFGLFALGYAIRRDPRILFKPSLLFHRH